MFFFSKDVFSAKVQLLVSPQPYPSLFGRRVAKKQIRRTFNSKAFNRCFVRNVEKNGITPPTLFFFIQRLSPAFFTGVSLGVPGDFCCFSILLGSPKIRKGWSSKRIIFRKVAVQNFWGVCQEEKYGLPKSSMVHLKIMDFSTLESHLTGYHFSDSMLPFVN